MWPLSQLRNTAITIIRAPNRRETDRVPVGCNADIWYIALLSVGPGVPIPRFWLVVCRSWKLFGNVRSEDKKTTCCQKVALFFPRRRVKRDLLNPLCSVFRCRCVRTKTVQISRVRKAVQTSTVGGVYNKNGYGIMALSHLASYPQPYPFRWPFKTPSTTRRSRYGQTRGCRELKPRRGEGNKTLIAIT